MKTENPFPGLGPVMEVIGAGIEAMSNGMEAIGDVGTATEKVCRHWVKC